MAKGHSPDTKRYRRRILITGFTLVELLVTISIVALLSSVVLASINASRMKSRDARRIENLRQIRLALELFFDANGYYPQSDCGWDCNGYRYSYTTSWDGLKTDLAPYIPMLPKDPINSSCSPWNANCYSYTYGNVGRTTERVQFDLTAQLEDTSNPQRCELRNWRFYFDRRAWCTAFGGSYSNQVYEASTN